jgi:hypothetical protein
MTLGRPDQYDGGIVPGCLPGKRRERQADHRRADDHQDETNGVDVDARPIPAHRIAENRADGDEDKRTSKSAGRHAKERKQRIKADRLLSDPSSPVVRAASVTDVKRRTSPRARRLGGRALLPVVALVSLYLLLPSLLEIFTSWRELFDLAPEWIAFALAAETASFAAIWELQRIAIRTGSRLPVSLSQLAGTRLAGSSRAAGQRRSRSSTGCSCGPGFRQAGSFQP